ncbi:MAG: hypothetical protein Tp139DCM904402_25 [Prokaryotic dsDNA virus sp.]|nr:MAG: hypothetical protein Tp139DCM904402_25 [Prokaryotic dsDNA virus sp.]
MNDVIKFESKAMVHILLAEKWEEPLETLSEIYSALGATDGCSIEKGRYVAQFTFKADSLESARKALDKLDWYMTPLPKQEIKDRLIELRHTKRWDNDQAKEESKQACIAVVLRNLALYPADLATLSLNTVEKVCMFFPQLVGFERSVSNYFQERKFIRKLIIKELDRLQ